MRPRRQKRRSHSAPDVHRTLCTDWDDCNPSHNGSNTMHGGVSSADCHVTTMQGACTHGQYNSACTICTCMVQSETAGNKARGGEWEPSLLACQRIGMLLQEDSVSCNIGNPCTRLPSMHSLAQECLTCGQDKEKSKHNSAILHTTCSDSLTWLPTDPLDPSSVIIGWR